MAEIHRTNQQLGVLHTIFAQAQHSDNQLGNLRQCKVVTISPFLTPMLVQYTGKFGRLPGFNAW